MNIDATTIYLWQLADNPKSSMCTGMFLSCVSGVISTIVYFAALDTNEIKIAATSLKICKASIIALLIINLVYPFIPLSKTIAMRVVIPKLADSKVIQQDLPDLYNTALEALKANLNTK